MFCFDVGGIVVRCALRIPPAIIIRRERNERPFGIERDHHYPISASLPYPHAPHFLFYHTADYLVTGTLLLTGVVSDGDVSLFCL